MLQYIGRRNLGVAQLVARYLGVVEAARSSRVTQTNVKHALRDRAPYGALPYAGMAELADALDSGSSRGSSVKVQVLLPAPLKALKTLRFRGFSLLNFVGRHATTAH